MEDKHEQRPEPAVSERLEIHVARETLTLNAWIAVSQIFTEFIKPWEAEHAK